LKPGTVVRWRDGAFHARGESIDTGIVVSEGPRHWIEWEDGQQTDGYDDWALRNVEVQS